MDKDEASRSKAKAEAAKKYSNRNCKRKKRVSLFRLAIWAFSMPAWRALLCCSHRAFNDFGAVLRGG